MKYYVCQSCLLTVVFILISLQSSFAQQKLIEASELTVGNLTGEETVKYNKLINSNMYTEHHLVQFGSLAGTQSEGRIKVKIPNHQCDEIVCKGEEIYYTSESKYTWYGEIISNDTCECSEGNITLISDEFGKTGHLTIDEDAYEITQIGDSRFVLSKIDDTKFTESECGVNENTPVYSPGVQENNMSSRDGNNCDVRCLVLFTPNALQTETGDINSRINLAVYQTNIALKNSKVNECDLRIILAGRREFEFAETDNIDIDINDFAENPDVQGLRDSFEADIVVLLTDGDYGGIFGVVHAIGPIDSSAFAIVEVGTATTGRYTFAHEVAHLFGAGHDDDSRDGIPHGHNFVKCLKRKRTIMNLLSSGKSRIQHYSNPEVTYSGKKTGITGERDNARQLRNEACSVANFRETINPFFVWVTGTSTQDEKDWFYGCPCFTKSLQAHTLGGGTGSSSFEWATSGDGIIWNTISTGQFVSFIMPCEMGEYIYVQVIATSPDGQIGQIIKTVKVASPLPSGKECPQFIVVPGGNNTNTIAIENAFPNPAPSAWTVDFSTSEEDKVEVILQDATGNIKMEVFKGVITKGYHSLIVRNDNLAKGVFLLRIASASGNSKIVKLLKL